MADPKDLAAQLEAFNQIEAQGQPWYKKQLPMDGRATFLPYRDTMEGSVFNQRELAMPGILAGALNAFSAPERARTGSDPTFNPNEEAINFATNVMGGGVGTSAAMKAPTGQGGKDLALNVWHGTPHEVKGKFDLAKIGTGEGNQAYGEGMYFTESKDLGNVYRRKLTDELGNKANNPDQSIQLKIGRLEDQIKQLQQSNDPNAASMIKAYTNRIAEIDKAGNLYKVDIPDASIPMMLNWDVPLNQQPNLLENIKKLGERSDMPKGFSQALNQALQSKHFDGQDLYYELTKIYKNPTDLSKAMQDAGFTGIRYLDAQSRGAKAGSSNFVVFKPETVKILEKNDKPVNPFNVEKNDVSSIFGQGAQQMRYTDPKTGSFIKLVEKPDGTTSVLGLEVPKEFRGTGIGKELQAQAMKDFPVLQGQVSSKAAATNAYKLGRRPVDQPNATLQDVLKMIDADSSVNMVTKEMQKNMTKPTRKELLQQEFDKLDK